MGRSGGEQQGAAKCGRLGIQWILSQADTPSYTFEQSDGAGSLKSLIAAMTRRKGIMR